MNSTLQNCRAEFISQSRAVIVGPNSFGQSRLIVQVLSAIRPTTITHGATK